MGYAYGKMWDEKSICEAIQAVMNASGITTMPTHSEMERVRGSKDLSNAVSKHGGSRYFAEMLGLEIKTSESSFGEEYELRCMNRLKHLGFRVEKAPARYPYDLFVENGVKVDVKAGRLYTAKRKDAQFFTCNLEKRLPTCDVFVFYCVSEEVSKVYVIPSSELSGLTQLSVGIKQSKYDRYLENWRLFNRMCDFNKKIMEI